jgi:2-isopropylmalate synthase
MRRAGAGSTARRADADGVKRSVEYFHEMVELCAAQGVSRIVVCDTTGGASPEEVTQVVGGLVSEFPGAKFGFHGHTDRGLGVANTRAAVMAGAVQVQGTLLGTGERCGNVNLTTVVGGMQLRGEAEFVTAEQLTGLTGLAHGRIRRLGWRRRTARRLWARGRLATWAGMHGSSESKDPGGVPVVRSGAGGGAGGDRGEWAVGRANIVLLSKQIGVPLTGRRRSGCWMRTSR